MQKVRRNALHRYWERNRTKLEKYGMSIEPDKRKLTTPNLGITFQSHLSTAEIAKICNGYIRMFEESQKMSHEIFAERMQDKLL